MQQNKEKSLDNLRDGHYRKLLPLEKKEIQ